MSDLEIPREIIVAIQQRHGWTEETAREKIKRAQEILILKSARDAADFLLESLPLPHKDLPP